MTTTTDKLHPALVGETTDLFVMLLLENERLTWEAIRKNMMADTLANFIRHGFSDRSMRYAELAEAAQLMHRAEAGDAEAKAIIEAIKKANNARGTWHDSVEEESDAREDHAMHLIEILRPDILSLEAANKRAGKASKGVKTAGASAELERIEEHSDKLPKAWAPKVRPGSNTALAWQALCEMHAEKRAPVPEAEWKRIFIADYLPATSTDPQGAFRDAKRNLKEQKAIRESAEGWTPRTTV